MADSGAPVEQPTLKPSADGKQVGSACFCNRVSSRCRSIIMRYGLSCGQYSRDAGYQVMTCDQIATATAVVMCRCVNMFLCTSASDASDTVNQHAPEVHPAVL